LKNTDNEIFNSLKALFTGKRVKIVIISHENPDGDAVGSSLGLAEVLGNFGHEVNVIVPNVYPEFLKWFSSELKVWIYDIDKKEAKNIISCAEVLICLDFNNPERAAKMSKQIIQFQGTKVMIDHHPYPVQFCDYMISETEYSSTAELVFRLVTETGLKDFINYASAEALYTGIMTDTGSFSHNISRPGPFLAAAELMKWGIDTEKIQSNVYHNFSADRMKLLGYCLNKKMEVFPEYRTAVIHISRDELLEYNFQPGDTEGFVNYPLSINNIIFSALFIEKKDVVKASFRSKGNFPVNNFSQRYFGGGGHLNAAGGESKLTLTETVERFKQLLIEFKHQLLGITE
jgi:phosphoesterase RecJ-like protein